MPRKARSVDEAGAFVQDSGEQDDVERVRAFRGRQEADLLRFRSSAGIASRRRSSNEDDSRVASETGHEEDHRAATPRRMQWRNAGDDSLEDYGVDEAAEIYDKDDMPLSRLLNISKDSNPN